MSVEAYEAYSELARTLSSISTGVRAFTMICAFSLIPIGAWMTARDASWKSFSTARGPLFMAFWGVGIVVFGQGLVHILTTTSDHIRDLALVAAFGDSARIQPRADLASELYNSWLIWVGVSATCFLGGIIGFYRWRHRQLPKPTHATAGQEQT